MTTLPSFTLLTGLRLTLLALPSQGTPAAPTAGAATSSTQIATTGFRAAGASQRHYSVAYQATSLTMTRWQRLRRTTISSSESTKAYVDTLISGSDTMHYKGELQR